jgi:hypothetical protein
VRRRLLSRASAFTAVAVLGLGAVALAATSGSPQEEPGNASSAAGPPATEPYPEASDDPFRAFSSDSWWNTPLPSEVPTNPAADEILEYLSTAPESGGGCLKLAGAGDSPWGHPIYWAKPGDPVYNLDAVAHVRAKELESIRIPRSARPASNNDGTMSVFDLERQYVVALTNAEYDPDTREWSAAGATVTYLNSNGLDAATGQSDEPRNTGTHRGNNGATMAVRWDMVQHGEIDHVLKIAAGPEVADRFVFPMVGSDGDYHGTDPAVPPSGLRMRIKPSIDLESLNLSDQALVIARALQEYGAYIGDSGGVTALKLENTMAEGRGQLWDVSATDLCGLPFSAEYWDVLDEDYDPTTAS